MAETVEISLKDILQKLDSKIDKLFLLFVFVICYLLFELVNW